MITYLHLLSYKRKFKSMNHVNARSYLLDLLLDPLKGCNGLGSYRDELICRIDSMSEHYVQERLEYLVKSHYPGTWFESYVWMVLLIWLHVYLSLDILLCRIFVDNLSAMHKYFMPIFTCFLFWGKLKMFSLAGRFVIVATVDVALLFAGRCSSS